MYIQGFQKHPDVELQTELGASKPLEHQARLLMSDRLP
jgi:hypothetical protein